MTVTLSIYQFGNIAAFIFAIILNILSSQPSKPLGDSNKDISEEFKTAFSPAGYAFSVWGIIYTFAAITIIWQALPAQKKYSNEVISIYLMANFLGNGLWTIAFATKALDLWLSTIIIFLGIMAPLAVLYVRMNIGDYTRVLSWGQATAHAFISMYLGWTCVACIANTSVTLVKYNLGDQSAWSIVMQTVAFLLATYVLTNYLDWVFAAPVAWGLIAIAVQQKNPEYPGNTHTVFVGYLLGSILWVWIGAACIYRLHRWYKLGSPMSMSVTMPFASKNNNNAFDASATAAGESVTSPLTQKLNEPTSHTTASAPPIATTSTAAVSSSS